jgi:hypothetical protein
LEEITVIGSLRDFTKDSAPSFELTLREFLEFEDRDERIVPGTNQVRYAATADIDPWSGPAAKPPKRSESPSRTLSSELTAHSDIRTVYAKLPSVDRVMRSRLLRAPRYGTLVARTHLNIVLAGQQGTKRRRTRVSHGKPASQLTVLGRENA